MAELAVRAANKVRRVLTGAMSRRPFALAAARPCISFTFDDFPASASRVGGAILEEHGFAGTFYLSMGLLGRESPSGRIADAGDVQHAVRRGHEIGCHTLDHQDGTVARPADYLASIDANQDAFQGLVPGGRMASFAYPLDGPGVGVKAAVKDRFRTLRAGGQTFNTGTIDLAMLKSYFLDARTDGEMDAVRALIDANARARGWLVFATHDVAERPSRYGCSIERFREVVDLARRSGAFVGSVAQVSDEVGVPAPVAA